MQFLNNPELQMQTGTIVKFDTGTKTESFDEFLQTLTLKHSGVGLLSVLEFFTESESSRFPAYVPIIVSSVQ